jgi:hypothetical protein
VTYQEVTSEEASGMLGRLCGRSARAENFEGHARSGDLRSSKYLNDSFQWIDGGLEQGNASSIIIPRVPGEIVSVHERQNPRIYSFWASLKRHRQTIERRLSPCKADKVQIVIFDR